MTKLPPNHPILDKAGKLRIFNAHTHSFTINHVPDYFARGVFPVRISRIRKNGVLEWIIKNLVNFLPGKNKGLQRLISLVRYMDNDTQLDIINILRQYYPNGTGFALLTMDMEYMKAEAPPVKFEAQLDELARIKQGDGFHDLIYPFICCDPRRIEPGIKTWEINIEKDFIGDRFLKVIRRYFEEGIFQGIKLYPALGFFPFDRRLKPIYDLALEFNLPIISHVIRGAVYFRGPKEYTVHPFLGKPLDGRKPEDFTTHFTHPLNYEILLNPAHLSKYWDISEKEASRYSDLKICLGHFGGEVEWLRFLEDPWIPENTNSLDINNWKPSYRTDSESQFSWFSICRDLMHKYPNVYADISYTLAFDYIYPLLKVILESDKKMLNRTLFGTDFYVVTKASAERKIAIIARAFLGNEIFTQIASLNPVEFLSNKLTRVPA